MFYFTRQSTNLMILNVIAGDESSVSISDFKFAAKGKLGLALEKQLSGKEKREFSYPDP